MHSRSYLFDARPDLPLFVSAKQYWDPATSSRDADAYTLIFTHGTGFPKEIWEPCLEDIMAHVPEGMLKVNDVWIIEAPNHGEAALLNEPVLSSSYRPVFRQEDYAHAIHALLSGFGTGVNVDFSKRRLLGIGHSMGTTSLMLTLTRSPPPQWSALVLIEPMLFPRGPDSLNVQDILVKAALKRRDSWASAEEAKRLMLSKTQWRIWEPRVFDRFLEYGLRPLHRDQPFGPVVLTTSPSNEAACLNDGHGATRSHTLFPSVVKRVPVHLIYGASPSYIPAAVREDVVNNLSGGKDRLASVSMVANAGHLLNVTHPTELARTIYDALALTWAQSRSDNHHEKARL